MDGVRRRLRDGAAEGEPAPVILVRDTARGPDGRPVLRHLLRSLVPDAAAAVVVVALSDPPESYADASAVVDGYSDRLGWNSAAAALPRVWRDSRDLDGLGRLILEAAGSAARFAVFFDSVSVLLRYHSARAVVAFCGELRAHGRAAALAMLLHADLHDARAAAAAFEYMASATVAVLPPEESAADGDGLVRVRQKRRNGRVLAREETFAFGPGGALRFAPAGAHPKKMLGGGRAGVPSKVQFSLGLTEREAEDRARVVLPFEHRGDGREERVYDGRDSIRASYLASRAGGLALADGEGPKLGEIRYLRDSDDERPDSDEDPDDDLDI